MQTRKFRSTHPLALAIGVSAVVTAASYLLPDEHSASAVGLIFLVATYALALPRSASLPPTHYGLSLGGLMETTPLSVLRLLKESAHACLIATLVALVILPPFWFGFEIWYHPEQPFDWARALSVNSGNSTTEQSAFGFFSDLALGHLLIVALPEEAFFRGYLQTALDDRWKKRVSFFGIELGPSLIVVSALFAVGHLATTGAPGRLAVFFPSLLFGALRVHSKGIGASVVLHAQCNVAAAILGRGFGLY